MNVVMVWHGRDAYDYTLNPLLHQTYKTLSEDTLKELVQQHDKYVKAGTLPWYLITVTRFEVGSEPVSETFHKANPPKTKILLNSKAKPEPELKKTINGGLAGGGKAVNIANMWAQVNAVDFFAPNIGEQPVIPQPVQEGHF